MSEVRIEVDRVRDPDQIEVEIRSDPAHWLAHFDPRVRSLGRGRTEIRLTMVGADAWTSVLTTMAALRQCGYHLRALQVESEVDALMPTDRLPTDRRPPGPGRAAAQRTPSSAYGWPAATRA